MKINIVEINKKKSFDTEIIFVKDIETLKEDKEILEILEFKAKDESCVLLAESKKIYVGYEESSYDSLAIAIATAIKKLKSTKFKSAKITLDKCLEDNFNALVEGALLGQYAFDEYKSEKETKKIELSFIVEKKNSKLEDILKESTIISKAVNKARDMVNSAPADFYPQIMAQMAQKLAQDVDISCEVHGESYLEKHKMMAMHSVGRASVHESKLIHLTYKPKKAKHKIVLVGKGLTYDSGGLSLKPSDFMVTMKADKSGACAVLATIWAIAKLELPIEVHAILGAVENMIGGNAYKPDDILKAKNGKTIEVRNTDAEGRLVLGDVVNYACDQGPDAVIDAATLTGAILVALGSEVCGLFANDQKLANELMAAAKTNDEYMWQLPIIDEHKNDLKAQYADLKNIGSHGNGGSAKGAAFIQYFLKEGISWAHLDIAGIAGAQSHLPYCDPKGASGLVVRTLVTYLRNQ